MEDRHSVGAEYLHKGRNNEGDPGSCCNDNLIAFEFNALSRHNSSNPASAIEKMVERLIFVYFHTCSARFLQQLCHHFTALCIAAFHIEVSIYITIRIPGREATPDLV